MRIVYAANRDIGVRCYEILKAANAMPCALLLPDADRTSDVDALVQKLPDDVAVLKGNPSTNASILDQLIEIKPDYILSVHYPHIFTRNVLAVPTIGTLNLHPALLPYNRGWHTPSWAIMEYTPIGATLHWVDEGVDSGDIAAQKTLNIKPSDTAHTLYARLLDIEVQLLSEAIPLIVEGKLPRTAQLGQGSFHRNSELATVAKLDSDAQVRTGDLLNLLRALTTNRIDEAAWFESDGRRYRVRIEIQEDEDRKE